MNVWNDRKVGIWVKRTLSEKLFGCSFVRKEMFSYKELSEILNFLYKEMCENQTFRTKSRGKTKPFGQRVEQKPNFSDGVLSKKFNSPGGKKKSYNSDLNKTAITFNLTQNFDLNEC